MLNKLSELNLTALFRARQALVTAVALILGVVILLVLASGQITAALDTNKKLTTEQKKLDQLNSKAQALEELKFSPEFAQAAQINDVLPSKKPLLELLNNLNSVANETGVAISDFLINPGEIASDSTALSAESKAKQAKKLSDYDRLDLELTVVGTLNQVRSFMDLIERVSPITTITNLTIDRKVGGEVTGDNLTRADLALSTYYYTKSVSSSIATPLPKIEANQSEIFQEILAFTPSELEEQTSIISGSQADLFGIKGLTIQSLESILEPTITPTPEATDSATN